MSYDRHQLLGVPVSLYIYKVHEVVKVVDGDTYDLKLDAGFHLTFASRFRLFGYDTPEMRRGSEFEKGKGQEALLAAEAFFQRHPVDLLRVETHKTDSFGRWLADVWAMSEDGFVTERLGWLLESRELATVWPARWREVYDVG